MAKRKKHNIALVYLVTIVITFALVGGTAYVIYNRYIMPASSADNKPSITAPPPAYAPTEEECQTALYIFDAGSEKTDVIFMLGRFLPTEKKFLLAPLYPNTFAQLGTTKSTLYEFYKKNGTERLTAAVESAVNVPVTQYMRFDKDAFVSFCDILGGARVNIPTDLIYENPETGETTVLRAGEQNLDGVRLCQMLTFPQFEEGEAYRTKLAAATVTDMINSALDDRLIGTLDNSFKTIINAVDTNINAYDFNFHRDAISYIIEEGGSPAQMLLPLGEENDAAQFVLSEDYKEDILYQFKVEAKVK